MNFQLDEMSSKVKFEVGGIIQFPIGQKGEIAKVTDTYIIIDVENGDPIKALIKDFNFFDKLELDGTH
jgi:uncharacterized protein YkvS